MAPCNCSANLLKILFFHTDLKDPKDCYAAKRLRRTASARSEKRSHLFNLSNPCEIYSLNSYKLLTNCQLLLII